MKRLFVLTGIILFAVSLALNSCKKDDNNNPTPTPTPTDKHKLILNKWWYTKQGLGDYYFKSDGTYTYTIPYSTGTWSWYSNSDSIHMEQSTGGDWNIWFREIKEHSFKMSQSNENHQNIYTFTDTK